MESRRGAAIKRHPVRILAQLAAAIAALALLAWVFWLAVHIRVEPQDYTQLSEVPEFQACSGIEGVGPVRTLRYIHPHNTRERSQIWITGEWAGSAFEEFAEASQLEVQGRGDQMNEVSRHLPDDFQRGLTFQPDDSIVVGIVCNGRKIFGAYSKRTGRFLFELFP